MDPEDDNIKQPNSIDKYANHPKQLIDMCLADFVSMTDIVQNDNKNIFPIKLPNNRIMKLHKKHKIIRFVNYKFKIDPENYCREKLLLYIPWINNELNITEFYNLYRSIQFLSKTNIQ